MRIIGGEFRGRQINWPHYANVRPTQDKVRQALFNVISARVAHSRVLDLFAGAGGFGLEALSRGADHAVFIDHNPRCVHVIRENVKMLQLTERSEIMRADGLAACRRLAKKDRRFDLVFIDPPYGSDLAKKALLQISEYDIVSGHSVVIVERHTKDLLPERTERLTLFKERCYGDTVLSLYNVVELADACTRGLSGDL